MKRKAQAEGEAGAADGSRALLALTRNAEGGAAVAPVETGIESHLIDQLAADYSDATGAANLLLAAVQMPPEFRGFIDALLGIAGGRDGWIEASDKQIASHAGRSTKWVQDWRKNLREWQTKNKATVIQIEDNYMDEGGEKHPHRYRVRLSRYAAACALLARASAEWERDPQRALDSVTRAARKTIPQLPQPKPRTRRKPDAARLIHQRLSTAITLAKKALEVRNMTGGNVEIDPQLIAELRAVLEKFSTTE